MGVLAKSSDNPFAKGAKVDVGSDAAWVIKGKTATRSGSYSGNFYHLFYDRKQLRLRITESAEDSEETARHHDQFSVRDVLVDGKRLPVFQWCLNNQQKHKRFLQQGLQVKKDVCSNQGAMGMFIMRLNLATLDALRKAKKLTFDLKPYRSPVEVNFDISDFSEVVATLNATEKPVATKPAVKDKAAPKVVTAPAVVATPAIVVPEKKCKASPPADVAGVKAIEYNCSDAAARAKATASVNIAVSKVKDKKKKVAAEREKRRLAAEAANKAEEERLAAEAAALAASAAQREAINTEISTKMLPVCQKKWAKGEHRCYCEKFIEHAPKEIQENSTCSGS